MIHKNIGFFSSKKSDFFHLKILDPHNPIVKPNCTVSHAVAKNKIQEGPKITPQRIKLYLSGLNGQQMPKFTPRYPKRCQRSTSSAPESTVRAQIDS